MFTSTPSIFRTLITLGALFSQQCAYALPAQSGPGASDSESSNRGTSLAKAGLSFQFADPSVLKVKDTYYAYATNSQGVRIPSASSTDFKNWKLLNGDKLLPSLPEWVRKGKGESIWGPDVMQIAEKQFVMYITAVLPGEDKIRCIGAATSDSPLGPFKPKDKAILCPKDKNVIGGGGFTEKVIDGAGFADGPKHYLLWGERVEPKGGGLAKTRTLAQSTTPDGLELTGQPIELTVADRDETFVNESPTMVKLGGLYVLLFSANAWYDQRYTVYAATKDSLTNGFKKQKEPVLKTGTIGGKKLISPGSADILFTDTEGGKAKIVFHSTEPGTEGGDKSKIRRLLWTAEIEVKNGIVKVV